MKTYFFTGTYQDQFWFSDKRRPNIEVLGAIAHGVGIGRYVFDSETGKAELLGYTPCNNNPATLCVSPNQKFLYVAHETKNFDGVLGSGGGVSAYRICHDTGELHLINTVSACGTFTAYVATDKTGQYVVAANHGSYFYTTRFVKSADGDYKPQVRRDDGSLVLFRVREDGGLEAACDIAVLSGHGFDVFNQASAHPHAVEITDDDYVIGADKGADRIDIFKIDRSKHQLAPIQTFKTEPGSAPRHIALHPEKSLFYIINEFNNKVVSYKIDKSTGNVDEIDSAFTVPMQFVGKTYTSCDIKIHPNGKFIYGTNHTFKSIVAYKTDDYGHFNLIGNFAEEMGVYREISVDPSGRYLIAGDMSTDRIDVFKINLNSGHIKKINSDAPALYPSCVHFARTNKGDHHE